MIKPSQIREKEFASSTMGGYKRSEVDSFLDEVGASYEQLYKENSELLKKMRLLVDNIEEYRKREQNGELAPSSALTDAKAEADRIITDAKLEAARIIADANSQVSQADSAQTSVDELRQLREKEEIALANIKAESERFRKSLLSMYTEHLSLIQSMVDGKSDAVKKSSEEEKTPLKKLDIKKIEVDEKFTYDDIDAFFAEAMSDEQSRIKEAFGGFRFEMGVETNDEVQLQLEETVSDFAEPISDDEPENTETEIIVESQNEEAEIIVEASSEQNELVVEFPSEAELSKDDEQVDDSDDIKPSFKISFPEDEEANDTEENLDDLFEGFFNSSDKSE